MQFWYVQQHTRAPKPLAQWKKLNIERPIPHDCADMPRRRKLIDGGRSHIVSLSRGNSIDQEGRREGLSAVMNRFCVLKHICKNWVNGAFKVEHFTVCTLYYKTARTHTHTHTRARARTRMCTSLNAYGLKPNITLVYRYCLDQVSPCVEWCSGSGAILFLLYYISSHMSAYRL